MPASNEVEVLEFLFAARSIEGGWAEAEALKACPCQLVEVNCPLIELAAVHGAVHEVIVGLFGVNAPPHVAKSCIRTMPKSIA